MNDSRFSIDNILAEVDKRREERGDIVHETASAVPETRRARSFSRKYAVAARYGFDWTASLLGSLAAVIVILTFVFRVNEVRGISMQPTLYENQKLFVWELFYTPARGDIVIIRADHLPNDATGEMGEPIVKRVIGIENDVISIDPATGTVYRNGEALDEPYIMEAIDESRLGNQSYPLTVPEGCVFVLGDNRNHSTDSRYTSNDQSGSGYYVGFVDIRNVVGKAVFKVWPLNSLGVL